MISVKLCMEVKGWLSYNGEETLLKVSTPRVERTNITDDRQIFDSNDPNVT